MFVTFVVHVTPEKVNYSSMSDVFIHMSDLSNVHIVPKTFKEEIY